MSGAVRMPPTEREYRDAAGLFSTGVAVIVANIGGEVFAMTVNAVASLSLSPMLVMFAPGKHTRFARHVGELKYYSITSCAASSRPYRPTLPGVGKQPPPRLFDSCPPAKRSGSRGAWPASNARARRPSRSAITGS